MPLFSGINLIDKFRVFLNTKAKVSMIDDLRYQLRTRINNHYAPEVPRLVIASYQPQPESSRLLKVCLEAIREFTDGSYDVWVVDNASPIKNIKWMFDEKWDWVNIVLNRTVSIPPDERGEGVSDLKYSSRPSYQNASALEVAAALIPPDTQYMMSMHMDTMPVRHNWLTFLMSKISGDIRASGVRMDHARVEEGILHVLGFIVDFQKFKELKLNYFPQLPEYDTGDLISVKLREAGHGLWACNNLRSKPELINDLSKQDSIYADMDFDRCLDDDGNVIFLHLGRGVVKTTKGRGKDDVAGRWEDLLETLIEGKISNN